MLLRLPTDLGDTYKSASQKARVVTEAWGLRNLYCPACSWNRLDKTPDNTEAVDFLCPQCESGYQLKARQRYIGNKILDAGYDAMLRALSEDRFPHLFVLSYDPAKDLVTNLLLIPNFCLSISAIERRKPLSIKARRAGWVGCNILLTQVPPDGRVMLIESGIVTPRKDVTKRFIQARCFKDISAKKRGWMLDVLTVLRSLGKPEFSLTDAYTFEALLSCQHPENRHIRPKIRQQLQVLRDLGHLEFLERGQYRWLK